MACLDTTVFLDLRGRGGRQNQLAAATKLREVESAGARRFTTRFNVAELSVGIYRSIDPTAERAAVTHSLAGITILEFDDLCAEQFARIQARLQSSGTPIGDMDVLIAAIALVNGEPILTRNTRHFSRIPSLSIIPYGTS